MEEISFFKKIYLYLIIFIFISLKANANVYSANCTTVENKNEVKNISLVFSFNRESVVFTKVNNSKIKYKIEINKIVDKNNFIFNASDDFYSINFKPNFSFIKKINTSDKPKVTLISNNLNSINIKCNKPKLIKEENNIEKVQKKTEEIDVANIMNLLQNNSEIGEIDLNKIMSSLNDGNGSSKMDMSQLKDLLKSRNIISQLTSEKTLNKIKSKEFLEMLKNEFNNITK